ncbi:MAG: histidine phosphatase family protein [bacterium]|nr:histidine phosphatase family protein [bacterium]
MLALTGMPTDLVVVCSGGSEGDIYYDTNQLPRDMKALDFHKMHSSKWRLTQEGRCQIELVADWIRAKTGLRFSVALISEEVMVKESAVLLALPDVRWQKGDVRLRAREWGELEGHSGAERRVQLEQHSRHLFSNVFFYRPTDGESSADVALRLTSLFRDVCEFNARAAIIVCRTKVAWVIRALLENMPTETYAKIRQDRDAAGQMHPGSILQYTRHEGSGVGIKDAFCRRRIVTPWKGENVEGVWEPMERTEYTNDELRAQVDAVPSFFNC